MAIARQMKQRQPKDTKMENKQLLYISLQFAKIEVKSNTIKEILVRRQYVEQIHRDYWLILAHYNETFAFLK